MSKLGDRAERLVKRASSKNESLDRKKLKSAAVSMVAYCQRFRGHPATATVYNEAPTEFKAVREAYEHIYGDPNNSLRHKLKKI